MSSTQTREFHVGVLHTFIADHNFSDRVDVEDAINSAITDTTPLIDIFTAPFVYGIFTYAHALEWFCIIEALSRIDEPSNYTTAKAIKCITRTFPSVYSKYTSIADFIEKNNPSDKPIADFTDVTFAAPIDLRIFNFELSTKWLFYRYHLRNDINEFKGNLDYLMSVFRRIDAYVQLAKEEGIESDSSTDS